MDDYFLFYVSPEHIQGGRILFPGEEARHLVQVLRKRPDDVVRVTDGAGRRMKVRLIQADKKQVTGEIMSTEEVPSGPELILAMGMIRRRDRLEFAIEKAVELGASRIVLVRSDHAENVSLKPGRIDRIIISAMKQSLHCRLPAWEERGSFHDVLAAYGDNRKVFLAHPEGVDMEYSTNKERGDETGPGFNSVMPGASPTGCLLMVGPEGGFSEVEMEQAVTSGAQLIRLGTKRLRTETAVCALMVLVSCSK
ncbi:MAG: RsmE family RNA methyltransferase [Balneolales bacterium]